MIISVRGTSGSGKTTLVRKILNKGKPKPIFGLLGYKDPEAYACTLLEVKLPVFILGPYRAPTSGCDMVHPYDLVLSLIEKYAPKGHVLFEGMIISSSYGRVGELMEKLQEKGYLGTMAFMSTSLPICIENVKSRRAARADGREFDASNTVAKFKQNARVREKALEIGKLRVVDLTMKTGVATVLKLLQDAT